MSPASYKVSIFAVIGRFCFGIFVRPGCFSWKTEDRKLNGFYLAFRSTTPYRKLKTIKERNFKRETPIWKAEVGKHVNIAMSGDLSFLLGMDKEQNNGRNPLDLATGRGKLSKQNSSKGENK